MANEANEENLAADTDTEVQTDTVAATSTDTATETTHTKDTENTEANTDGQSAVYVGRWRGLVSTTNWEKGRVISEWRQSLVEGGAEPSEYSDEAWSRRVGNITPQHVGRLRRVHESHGDSYTSFEGLFWSHFHATIDWDDAEMWLEGAVQNDWSVSQMRRQRWETLGGAETDKPQDADIVSTDKDEDIDFDESQPLTDTVDASVETVEGYAKEERAGADEDDEDEMEASQLAADGESVEDLPLVRPFADLPELPDDLADAFDDMKLAILRHKVNEWEEIPASDILIALDALKQLVTAPSDLSTAS